MIKKYYGYYHSPIGILEIICSEDKLLSVMVIDKEKPTGESNLILENTIIQLDEYFNGNRKEFDLKISLEGTNFQKQIWNELMKIPYGKTLSYKELAIKIGNEKAVRAVGNANGRNIIWVIVPCHRVIGTNGSLTGYAGGLGVKQWLLEHEKSFVNVK